MKFSVTLDSVNSVIAPSETGQGFTWKQAIEEVVSYCDESGYSLQREFFQVVSDSKEEYLAGKFPLVLA